MLERKPIERKPIKEWVTLEHICKAAKPGEGARPGLEVTVEKVRPVMEGDRSDFIRDPRVTIRISRGKATLFLSGEELHVLQDLIAVVHDKAVASALACDEEVAKLRAARDEVRRLRDETREARANEGFGDPKSHARETGKTARKKANGKAGEAYARKKKTEHSEESKRFAATMGAAGRG